MLNILNKDVYLRKTTNVSQFLYQVALESLVFTGLGTRIDTSKDVWYRPSAYANTIGENILIKIRKPIFFSTYVPNVHYSTISHLPVTKLTLNFVVFFFSHLFFSEKPNLISTVDMLPSNCGILYYTLNIHLFLQPQFVLHRERCRFRPL